MRLSGVAADAKAPKYTYNSKYTYNDAIGRHQIETSTQQIYFAS